MLQKKILNYDMNAALGAFIVEIFNCKYMIIYPLINIEITHCSKLKKHEVTRVYILGQ